MPTDKQKLNTEVLRQELPYLELLARSFPTVADAATEIINLEAILNLPKGTEHFLTDIHGEHEAFEHVLRNASGAIERKVNDIFGNTLRHTEKKRFCTLIYYPKEVLRETSEREEFMYEWYVVTLNRLVKVCQTVSSKYTRSKVRKALPQEFSYIIQELLHESSSEPDKEAYINKIISTIIDIDRADEFIIAMCNLIQRLVIDRLHIVGDIYDRGPGAHIIMDMLDRYHNVDIQWGNHDLLWMGAASGNKCCIANVLRVSLRYANLATLEDGYGINLLPLATFAMEMYADDPCTVFMPKLSSADKFFNDKTIRLIAQMHKAIAIIQFKVEHEAILRRPEFDMADRNLLHLIDFKKGTITVDGKEHELLDKHLPTIDPKNPYALTEEEEELMDMLQRSFVRSEKLDKHMRCLFEKGSFYTICNSNLLFHASIPLNADGTLKKTLIDGQEFSGRQLLDKAERMVRTAFFKDKAVEPATYALDYMWYLWCGKNSPAFDKSRMTTFERYFIADKDTHKEGKGEYYSHRDKEEVCLMLLDEFGVQGKHRHIINGHVPVKKRKGESPLKANGRLLVIDGGFSRAYQPETGIAGYTLVYNSHGMQLVQHEPFTTSQVAITKGIEIKSTNMLVEYDSQRMMVKDTDIGVKLKKQVEDLKKLLMAFRRGLIKQQR